MTSEVRVDRGLSSANKGGRGLYCGHPHFLCKKLRIFLKFVVCDPHGQGGGGGQFFAILCGHFYGRPLLVDVGILRWFEEL